MNLPDIDPGAGRDFQVYLTYYFFYKKLAENYRE